MPDLGPGDSAPFALDVAQMEVGSVIKLSYHCDAGEEQAVLRITPQDDILIREIRHDQEERDGMVYHDVYFQVERIGI